MRIGVKDPAASQVFDAVKAVPGWIATVVFDSGTDEMRAGETDPSSTVRIGQVVELASQIIAATEVDVLDAAASGRFCGGTVKWERTTYLLQWVDKSLYAVVVLNRTEANTALAMHHVAKFASVSHLF